METDGRVVSHPVLPQRKGKWVRFFFNGARHLGIEGEMVSSAVFAAGERVFGHHSKDGSPQGLFCANGQCSQCTLVIDGEARKSCITPLREGMRVETLEGLPELPGKSAAFFPPPVPWTPTSRSSVRVPRERCGGREGGRGLSVVVDEDKDRPGGSWCQTHKFFGSVAVCHAGTWGSGSPGCSPRAWNPSHGETLSRPTVLSVISDWWWDQRPGGYSCEAGKVLVRGAREKSLPFRLQLPGDYGREHSRPWSPRLIRCSERIFVWMRERGAIGATTPAGPG